MKTVNEMRTPDNLDSPTPQEFGNSWTAAEVSNFVKLRKRTLKFDEHTSINTTFQTSSLC